MLTSVGRVSLLEHKREPITRASSKLGSKIIVIGIRPFIPSASSRMGQGVTRWIGSIILRKITVGPALTDRRHADSSFIVVGCLILTGCVVIPVKGSLKSSAN